MNPNLVKWVVAGVIAAVVSTLAIFSKWGKGNALVVGVLMAVAGLLVMKFFKGVPSSVPAGFIVAGGVVLANAYIVPSLPDSFKNIGA